MMEVDRQIRLLESNLATFRSRIASTADKDGLRRQIKACEARIRELKAEES